jgi:hypothetical protein
MATATVEHIYTWTGSGTSATYTKNIDLNTINGVSFTGAHTIYMLETTISAHGADVSTISQSYRAAKGFVKDNTDYCYDFSSTAQGVFSAAADNNAQSTVAATPIAYSVSGTTVTVTFTPNSTVYTLYFRAICKIIAYKAS